MASVMRTLNDNNIAGVKSVAKTPITNLKAHFKPKQNLNGLSKPWYGGCGVNLFDYKTVTQNCYFNARGEMIEDEQWYCSDYIKVIPGESYRVIRGGGKANMYHACYTKDKTYVSDIGSVYDDFTIPDTVYYIRLSIQPSYTLEEVLFVRGTSFVYYTPYENICPISGWNSIKFQRSKTNIGHLVGLSATKVDKATDALSQSNESGTTVYNWSTSTIYYKINQPQYPNEREYSSKENGYFYAVIDNLTVGQRYTFIVKTSDSSIGMGKSYVMALPDGSTVYGERSSSFNSSTAIFKNVLWEPYDGDDDRCVLEFRLCGESMILRDFVVLPAGEEYKNAEEYSGSNYLAVFPPIGKNLFDPSKITPDSYINTSTLDGIPIGKVEPSTSGYAASDYIYVLPNTVYTINYNAYNGSMVAGAAFYKTANADSVIRESSLTHQLYTNGYHFSYTFTTPEDCNYFRFTIFPGATNVQLELGPEATTYEPYNTSNTVYGGCVDLTDGKVEEQWETIVIDDTFNAYISGTSYRGEKCTDVWFDAGSKSWGYSASYANNLTSDDTMCDSFALQSSAIWGNPDLYPWCYVLNATNQIHCVFENYVVDITSEDTNAEAIEKIKTWLHDHPITLAYRLAEPKAVAYFEHPEVKLDFGKNNFWSNANGPTELTYAIHDSAEIRAAKKRIVAATPHIVTPSSASIQTFTTDMVSPLKECKIHFAPVQEGTGDPSPDNIRPITGLTGVDLYSSKAIDLSPNNYTPETINGGLMTYLGDNRFSFTGNLSAITDFEIPINLHMVANKEYYMYIITSNVEDTNFGLSFRGSGIFTLVIKNNDSTVHYISYTPTSDKNFTTLRIKVAPAAKDFTFGLYVTEDPATLITTNWSDSGTIYGGYVDLVNGEVVEECRVATPENIAIRMRAGTAVIFNSGKAIRCYVADQDAPCVKSVNWTVECTHMSDCGPVGNWSMDASSKDGFVAEAQGNSIMFIASGLGFTTKDEWAQWVIDNNVKYIYPLSTPIHYPIDHITLKTLRGTNNIWSNANGNIELSYWKH